MPHRSTLSRRDLLRAGTLAAAGAVLLPAWEAEAQNRRPVTGPYAPFRMGIQSYSLRGYKLDEALQKTKDLGLHYWESFPAHIPLTTDAAKIAEVREKLRAARVRMPAFGVVPFGKDEAANRKTFECARAMGVRTLSADPEPGSFDQLDHLVEEFQINVAIHNHGPGARYDKIESVVNAVKGRNKRIGACVDCGHYLRSREDPVKAIETLGDRVYGCHLKDVKNATQFTILGEGDLDTLGVLKALRANNYRGIVALEYEEHPENPIADIEKSLAAVRAAVAKLPPA